MAFQQKGNRVRLVLSLDDRRVARSLVPEHLRRQRFRGKLEPRLRVGLATRDLLRGGLTVRHRVQALHLVGYFAVRDGLNLKRMQFAEIGNLLKSKRGV